jgi:hypothetical protein
MLPFFFILLHKRIILLAVPRASDTACFTNILGLNCEYPDCELHTLMHTFDILAQPQYLGLNF